MIPRDLEFLMQRATSGGVIQIAYVVENLDEALAHWTSALGVGPFFVTRHATYERFEYLGGTAAPDLSLAFAFSGDTNIELIEQHDETPSPFLDFLRAHGPGVQHLAVLSDDLDADTRLLAEQSSDLLLRLVNGENGVETRFYSTSLYPNSMLELIGRNAAVDEGFKFMKEAARTWDGKQVIAG